MVGELAECLGQGLVQGVHGPQPREGHQQGVAGDSLDHRGQGTGPGTDDQIALPVALFQSELDLGWAGGDQDRVADLARTIAVGPTLATAAGPAGPQAVLGLGFHHVTGIDREVDRLVGQPHLGLVRVLELQPPGDLLR
jgi:hypothetical protein